MQVAFPSEASRSVHARKPHTRRGLDWSSAAPKQERSASAPIPWVRPRSVSKTPLSSRFAGTRTTLCYPAQRTGGWPMKRHAGLCVGRGEALVRPLPE